MKNILLFLTDQWRHDTIFDEDCRCRTPNLERFSREATVFENAYSCYPLCTPARGALFTGKWPYQNNLTDNVGGDSFYPHGKLNLRHRTFLERLRDEAGFHVSYAGKWHLGEGTLSEREIPDVLRSDGMRRAERAGETKPTGEPDEGANLPYYATFSRGTGRAELIVEDGIRQIERAAGGEAPFCSVISLYGPHFGHFVPKRFADMYEDLPADYMPPNFSEPFAEENKPAMQSRPWWPCQDTTPLSPEDWRKTIQHYYAFCTWLDELFGKVIDRLRKLDLLDNTVVAFTCDHGEKLGAHGNFDKGPDFYEETMHLPMIIRDPQRRSPKAADSFVNLRDLFPTLIDLAGADDVLGDDEKPRSFWKTDNDCTFYCYDSYQGREFKLRGIRTKRYKYNWSPHDLCELYDTDEDPGEQNNRIDDESLSDVKERLHKRLFEWMEREGDYLLCARHLPPPGTYIDGRDVSDQHLHRSEHEKLSDWKI